MFDPRSEMVSTAPDRRARPRRVCVALARTACALALGTIVATSDAAGAAESPRGGELAFSDGRALRLIRQDGSRVTLATGGQPQGWSPDGSALLVVDERGLRSLRPDGRVAATLSRRPDVTSAAWSSGGKHVAFVAGFGKAGTRASGLWVVDADGTGLRWIARIADAYHAPRGLTWAPDGATVVVASYLARTFGIFEVAVAGRAPHQIRVIRHQQPAGSWPKWSPDGTRLLFSGTKGRPPSVGTYVMKPDGSDARRVRACGNPSWSPDGARIACVTNPPQRRAIAVIDPNGKLLDRIAIPASGVVDGPSWSADRRALAFTIRPDPYGAPRGRPGVYTVRLGDHLIRRVVAPTRGHTEFRTPLWRLHVTATVPG